MKTIILPIATAAMALCVSAAWAEPYVDYTPQKGAWHATVLKVDPNHIDDYVTGLQKTWVPAEELAKKHGLIDAYQIMIKVNAADGQGNVLLTEHLVNMGTLEPDQTRDQAIEKEAYAASPKTAQQAQTHEFDKYRTFVGDDYWQVVTPVK